MDRHGYGRFGRWTIALIGGSAVLSILAGLTAFWLNSTRGPAAFDLQGPSGIASVIPGLAGVLIAALAVYFYLRTEDPTRREAFEIQSHLQRILQSVLLYIRILIQVHAVRDQVRLRLIGEANGNLLKALQAAIHETRAFRIVGELYERSGDAEGQRQLAKLYMQLIDAQHLIEKGQPQVVDLKQIDELRRHLTGVDVAGVYQLLSETRDDLLDWEREAFEIMIARSEGRE